MPPQENDVGRDEHGRWEDELAAYALGSLEQAESVALKAHLSGCEHCRATLEWLQPAVALLPASVAQLEPPRHLRRRTIEAARADLGSARSRPSWAAWRVPAIATAALAAVALAIGIGALGGEDGAGLQTVSVDVVAHGAPAATGMVVTDGQRATLEVEHLPRISRADVYQAWVQRGERIEPSTTFIVDREGHGVTTIPHVEGAERVMVTREPRGGSEVPSTAPLLQATLTAS